MPNELSVPEEVGWLDAKYRYNEKENLIQKYSKKLAKKELAVVRKRIMTVVMSHKWANSKILGLLAGTLSAVPAALVALGLQKSSARAGRFTAKRELEKNPQNSGKTVAEMSGL